MTKADFKEYSRLRDIITKRIGRAVAAGKGTYIHIPTVKEIKKAGNPADYMAALQSYYQMPGASLRSIKGQPGVSTRAIELPVSAAEKKRIRRNEQKRKSKVKRAVEKEAGSPEKGRKRVGYLKALEKVKKDWQKVGANPELTMYLNSLTPGQAKAFVDYMDYRFSQGDYKATYVIDTFVKDFAQMLQRGYNVKDFKSDFNAFLDRQKELEGNKAHTAQYGIDRQDIDRYWKQFSIG